ncbi:MAG: nitronate monooxygenase family protein [Ilumatobacteraceae bacterium]|nr:MAG: nitronate monooxygenase [Actinomycetota bacterium]
MHTRICDVFDIEYPIFAFTHCRDVVAAVSKAGGLGVLGAVGFSPEQLEVELTWIDEHVNGKPYGVDFVMPSKAMDVDGHDPADLRAQVQEMIPERHRQFVDELIERFDLPRGELEQGDGGSGGVVGWISEVAHQLVEVAFAHPVSLAVNALGSPPPDVIDLAHERGVKVAALAGRAVHAERHVRSGVDVVIAQGTEAGGHTGDVATMVLIPEVVDAVGDQVPVLAAGGIGTGRQIAAALALGADGVWMGSVWLGTAESDSRPEQLEAYLKATSSDTVRSKSYTGKPARMLRTPWTDAWEAPDSPGTLPMPLQNILIAPASQAYYRAGRVDEFFVPVGQIVGAMKKVRPVRDVMFDMVSEYLDTMERMNRITGTAE